MKLVKKILKITGIVIGSLVILVGLFYVKAHYNVEQRRLKKYAVEIESIEIKADSAMIAEGARLTAIKGCRDCHGDDMAGKIFTDDPLMGTLAAKNLTKGKGGLPENFDPRDWLRALKHGLNRDSTALLVMPSHKFAKLTEKDMKALIAFCVQLPEVDRELPVPKIGPLTRVLTDLGQIPLFPAEYIDHTEPFVAEIKPEVSIVYGKYLSQSCTGCHQETLKGGKALAPGQPVPADLTPSGHPGKWSDDQFIATLRTGKTPEGKSLDARYMPWPMTKSYTDVELKALKMYLNSL